MTTDTSSEFEAARAELRRLAREDNWSGVAVILNRLPRLAGTAAEQALASQDIGVFHRSKGKRADAAEAFEAALSYARDADPLDPALLAGAITDVGDTAMEAHRSDVAVTLFVELVDLRRVLAAETQTPQNRNLLALALERLADAREHRGHRSRALALYQESLQIIAALAEADPGAYAHDLAATRERVAELETRLA